MSLEDLRKEIDKVDAEIVKLMGERIKLATEIGQDKKQQGKQIEDLAREERVLEHVKRLAHDANLSEETLTNIYRQIITVCKETQTTEETVVAFQGEMGAYSEEAALNFFSPPINLKPCESLEDVFKLVEQNEVKFGIVPVENSLEGSISRVYDLLPDSSLRVCGEIERLMPAIRA